MYDILQKMLSFYIINFGSNKGSCVLYKFVYLSCCYSQSLISSGRFLDSKEIMSVEHVNENYKGSHHPCVIV